MYKHSVAKLLPTINVMNVLPKLKLLNTMKTFTPLTVFLIDSFIINNIFMLVWPCIIYNFALFRFQLDTLIILYIHNLVFYLSLHVSDRLVHHQEIKCFYRTSSFWQRSLGRCLSWAAVGVRFHQKPPKTDNDRGNGARSCLCDKSNWSPDDGPIGPKNLEIDKKTRL
jgi:hypothetical protein